VACRAARSATSVTPFESSRCTSHPDLPLCACAAVCGVGASPVLERQDNAKRCAVRPMHRPSACLAVVDRLPSLSMGRYQRLGKQSARTTGTFVLLLPRRQPAKTGAASGVPTVASSASPCRRCRRRLDGRRRPAAVGRDVGELHVGCGGPVTDAGVAFVDRCGQRSRARARSGPQSRPTVSSSRRALAPAFQ